MSKYNPTQRARDLKRENSALRSELRDVSNYANNLHSYLRDCQRIWAKGDRNAATQLTAAQRKLRNHRVLSGVLLVLAVAGWLV